ncbi:MAG: hypothetical protein U0R17_04535 [Acidimicrobiia bacterium]
MADDSIDRTGSRGVARPQSSSRANGGEVHHLHPRRGTSHTRGEDTRGVVRIGANRDYRTPNVPQRQGIGEYLLAGAYMAGVNLAEGARGLYDSLCRGVFNPSKQNHSLRGTTRQRLAFVSVAVLTAVTGKELAPRVIGLFQQTPGEEFVDRMYTNRSQQTQVHDAVLPTRIAWVEGAFGPDGADVLSEAGMKKIEHVGTWPSKYDREREEIEEGFTALDRIADLTLAQGTDADGNVIAFDLTKDGDVQRASTLLSYVQDAVNSGLVDESILGLTPNGMLGRFNGVDEAFRRADYRFGYGNRGEAPAVPGPIDFHR